MDKNNSRLCIDEKEANRLIQQSMVLIERNSEKTEHIKQEMAKNKKKIREVEKSVSLLL